MMHNCTSTELCSTSTRSAHVTNDPLTQSDAQQSSAIKGGRFQKRKKLGSSMPCVRFINMFQEQMHMHIYEKLTRLEK